MPKNNQSIPAFLIAAPKSNSGKTMLTLGLLRALKNRGLKVQPFKCGPDYIDPMHHQSVSGNASYNLDVWMSHPSHVQSVFQQQASRADVAVVEGVMGLFDGARKDKGSSAEIAQLLDLPIILVVDASSVAYSVAPLLYGFKHFNPNINLAGVIFNKVAGESHYQFLKEAAADAEVPSLGYMPRNEGLTMESRHLGLLMPQDNRLDKCVNLAAQLLEEHVDLNAILALTQKKFCEQEAETSISKPNKLRVAIAMDEAFNFMYPANIDALKQMSEVVFFSPLHDSRVPDVDLLWFPGGYPELFAQALSNNKSMLQSIKDYWQNGGRLVAECGGMMYLGKLLNSKEYGKLSMAGIFDYSTSAQNMKLTLGYRRLCMDKQEFYGHEFHYSGIEESSQRDVSCQSYSARDQKVDMPVFRKKGGWASYMHLYLGELDKMKAFVKLIMNG